MQLPAAAIVYFNDDEADALLANLLKEYKQKGWRVRGLVTHQGKDPYGALPMQLRDIHTQEVYLISQELGGNSSGCTLDMAALTEAGKVLRKALEEQPDLVFINRFGQGEAQGRGLSQELIQLISAGIPVLTLVNEKYLADWQNFSDKMATTLPLDVVAIEKWLAEVNLDQVKL